MVVSLEGFKAEARGLQTALEGVLPGTQKLVMSSDMRHVVGTGWGGASVSESGVLRPGSAIMALEGVWQEPSGPRGSGLVTKTRAETERREGSRSWEKPGHESWIIRSGLDQKQG